MEEGGKKRLDERLTGCREVWGDGLKSMILYGSGATGDFVAKYSDLNILIILDRIDLEELTRISPFVERWCRKGDPPPLLLTGDEIRTSQDVFPLEFLDIRDNHQVLFGEDPFIDLEVDDRNLRLQCEHEMKGKIIRLREQFLLVRRKDERLRELMARSVSTFIALFRGMLRLRLDEVPGGQRDVLRKFAETMKLDLGAVEKVLELKEGRTEIRGDPLGSLFGDYLAILETVAERVDTLLGEAG